MKHNPTEKHLWYLRRNGTVTGPFPVGQIKSYLLLGRIRDPDELSWDSVSWEKSSKFPEFDPALADDQVHGDREKRQLAYRHEDERSADNRRQASGTLAEDKLPEVQSSRRRHGERRESEPASIPAHRRGRRRMLPLFTDVPAKPKWLPMLVAISVAVAGWSWLLWFRPVPDELPSPNCAAPPAPKVNWGYCHLGKKSLVQANLTQANLDNAILTGADLRDSILIDANLHYANLDNANLHRSNLRGARVKGSLLRQADLTDSVLENADMSYTDLAGANLQGANITNTDFTRAIWIDGRVCAAASSGTCN